MTQGPRVGQIYSVADGRRWVRFTPTLTTSRPGPSFRRIALVSGDHTLQSSPRSQRAEASSTPHSDHHDTAISSSSHRFASTGVCVAAIRSSPTVADLFPSDALLGESGAHRAVHMLEHGPCPGWPHGVAGGWLSRHIGLSDSRTLCSTAAWAIRATGGTRGTATASPSGRAPASSGGLVARNSG